MADGFDIHLGAQHAEKLKALADRLGMSPEDYAALLIDREAEDATRVAVDPDPALDRAILDAAHSKGALTPWADVRDSLLARHRR
ncbi:antitoxin [Caulobacter sp. BP25]|uniref:antitoxin n=1 Tax=Caulobacter sp. BP25 TaxID=2048900 RepID=UPI000C12CF7B|nr:antitoxin [Caulobacter sp. BP25]PHY21233.1 antitoxin [Caulobacter sp. BP25]